MDPDWPLVILGIGNCLLTDDGVGVHAARILALAPPPRTRVVDVGTDFLSALPFLEEASRVLVIDAMEAGQPPGTLYRCRLQDLHETNQRYSLHEFGLSSLHGFLSECRRPPIHLLGVQPASLALGLELSPAVAAALPGVIAAARAFAA